MASREAVERWEAEPRHFAATPHAPADLGTPASTTAALLWAGAASTLHRVRRGEGALLAINLSLLVHRGTVGPRALASALVSLLTIALMYAFNDLYDAPTDVNNPKKDLALVSTYLDHRAACGVSIAVLHLLTLALTFLALGTSATLAAAGAMLVNVTYSTLLKGVPLVDVLWCGLWGASYAAIVDASPWLLLLVGLMTAVCHLYQTLDDRASDAANAITTTAVRSAALSRNVLVALSVVLFFALRLALGTAWAATAFTPLALFFACQSPRAGWLLAKAYFGVMWLAVLEIARSTA